MIHKKAIYIFAISILTILVAVIVSIKATQSAKYQIYMAEKTFYVKLPDDIKSLVFESIAPKYYYSAAKIIIPENNLKGFVDSLNDTGYSKSDLNGAYTVNYVNWWKLDINKISGYYMTAKGEQHGVVAYEVYISDSNKGFVTLYLSKYFAAP